MTSRWLRRPPANARPSRAANADALQPGVVKQAKARWSRRRPLCNQRPYLSQAGFRHAGAGAAAGEAQCRKGSLARTGRAQPELHPHRCSRRWRRRQPHMRSSARTSQPGQEMLSIVPLERRLGHRRLQGNPTGAHARRPARRNRSGRPGRTEVPRHGRPASAAPPAPSSACCRRRTPPETTSRWCSASRSASTSTTARTATSTRTARPPSRSLGRSQGEGSMSEGR